MGDDGLKLGALDAEDLAVIAAHMQDAVFKVGEMAWLPGECRFAAVVNRFDWEFSAAREEGPWRRRRAGLSVDRVEAARLRGIPLDQPDAVLNLLTIEFDPGEAPGGTITLVFAGGGAVRLDVECIEARLSDLGPAWETMNRPEHAGEADQASASENPDENG